jgi:hypothetical protein
LKGTESWAFFRPVLRLWRTSFPPLTLWTFGGPFEMIVESTCQCAEIAELTGAEAAEYATRHLQRTGSDTSGWVLLLRCPETDLGFTLDYPQSEQHGGGPARLRPRR